MNRKEKGSRNERKVRDYLRALGYHVVKAGGSLGMWDLVAIDDSANCIAEAESPLVVQVKSNRKPSAKEMNNMRKSTVKASKVLAIVYDRKGIEWIYL